MSMSRTIRILVLFTVALASACQSSKTDLTTAPTANRAPTKTAPPAGWVDIADIATRNGLHYRSDAETGRHYLEGKSHVLEFDERSRVSYFDKELVVLDSVPKRRSGGLLVPSDIKARIDALLHSRPAARKPAAVVRNLPEKSALAGEVFIIDAGHGGKDPGTAAGGAVEKAIVLDIAKRVAARLKSKGARAVQTRPKDRFVSLDRRVQIANQTRPDAFVSIHVNSAGNRKARGVEIYRPIRREAGHESGKLSRSARLAEFLYRELAKLSPAKDRGVKPNSRKLRVVRKTHAPAVLIEVGFVTNPSDRALLKNSEYRDKLAKAIVRGLENYSASRR
ncbi:MAG TPA: N-acetylmuramoyl-L-alanine amidase [Planctomycetes bacterium]|nr:N-acetylmuramoyl-L-alanine amidase [Planctomycetota bacterium]